MDDGNNGRTWWSEDGEPLTHEEAHGRPKLSQEQEEVLEIAITVGVVLYPGLFMFRVNGAHYVE